MTHSATAVPGPHTGPFTLPNLAQMVWNLAPLVLVHLGAVAIFWTGGTLFDWVLFAVLVYLRGFCVTVGYHRYFAHRSFKTSRTFQFVLAVLCCATLQKGPLWWAMYHRHHHRHSDDPDDPHSPHHGGFLWSYIGWLFVPLEPDWRVVSDLRKFPELVWLERFWLIPGLLLAGLCWWVGGWSCVCVSFCLSAVISFHAAFLVNSVTHLAGTRRYPTRDHSRNSYWVAILTMGEGWHNNHHQYPSSAQFGQCWWEIDGGFRAIRFLERMGLIWSVRRVPPPRSGTDPQDR